MKKPLFIAILGPSGIGKDTVIADLIKAHPDWEAATSYTTRPRRPSETHSKFHFVTEEEFLAREKNGEFLEIASPFGTYSYALPKKEVLDSLSQGRNVIRQVDLNGLRQLKQTEIAPHIVSIFLYVDNLDILRDRLLERGDTTGEELEARLAQADDEIARKDECDTAILSTTQEDTWKNVDQYLNSL